MRKRMMCIALAACQNTDNGDVTPPADTTAPETTAPVADTAAPEQSADPEPAGITVTDMMGREVTLDAPASKVVALSAGECEIVYALGAGELVVGRGEYCDYPAEVFDVASVKSGSETYIRCQAPIQHRMAKRTTLSTRARKRSWIRQSARALA